MSIQNLIKEVSDILIQQGHDHYGFAKLEKPHSFEIYENWIQSGLHGEMEYLKNHIPQKREPQMLLPQAKSAIVVAFAYHPHPSPVSFPMISETALYAKGSDYHFWVIEKLNKLIESLMSLYPDHVFLSATDSKPVMERDLAYKAGLGWIGKNTCLIHEKRGSLFVLGEILTSLDLQSPLNVQPDRCGNCTRCIDACPTEAFVEPKLLDARKCISFLTIESKKLPPLELRDKVGQYYFGCDICQTVCPWNHKHYKTPDSPENARSELINDLRLILTSSGKSLERLFAGTPLTRASRFGHIRNAILVATHRGLYELRAEISSFSKDERLAPLVEWSLAQDPKK